MEHRERSVPDYTSHLATSARAVERFRTDPSSNTLTLLATGEAIQIRELRKVGRFDLGKLVATPGALEAIQRGFHIPSEFLLRHKRGDWGHVSLEDVQANEDAVRDRSRVFSAYRTRLETTL